MPLTDLPLTIQKHILEEMNKPKDSYYDEKDNEVHVTSLLYCIRKTYFSKKNPLPLELRAAFNMYRGNELDNRWTPLFPDNQQRCTYRIDGIPLTIVGKYDFIDPDDGAIADLKTVKNLFYSKEGPKAEHVKQIRFYAYMNSIYKAKIIYMDYGDCIVHNVEITDDLCREVIEELVEKAISLYTAYQTNVPPEEDMTGKEWLCGFGKEYQCLYYNVCHNLSEEGALKEGTMAELALEEHKRVGKKVVKKK